MTLRPRKLLAAAPLLAAALAGCGTTASPAARSAALAAPVRAPMAAQTLVLAAAPAPAPAVAAVVPAAAATPMCDSNGRPLSGNVRTKSAEMQCTPDQLAAAAVTPGTE